MSPIVIEAPSLVHLHLQDFEELQFVDSRLSSLLSAQVDICKSKMLDQCVIGFLAQISNAKELYLSRQTMRLLSVVLRKDDVQLPAFPNLTIEPAGSSCLLLHSLLESASKLHHLVIDFGSSDSTTMEWEASEPAACTPKCLLSSLEEVEIKDLVAEDNEMKMAAYLLKAGVVLKMKKVNNMCLVHDDDLKLLAPLPEPPKPRRPVNNAKQDFFELNQINDPDKEIKDILKSFNNEAWTY
ncbi:unnamed protein product [Linum trigynum]|uniref:FBD domain-containing protein n=1 Tax=Linum trigynum TaxID=586398 RepID=A0AAV2FI79_9ROSI